MGQSTQGNQAGDHASNHAAVRPIHSRSRAQHAHTAAGVRIGSPCLTAEPSSRTPKLPYTLARVDSDWPGTPAIEKEGYWGWPGTPLMQKKGIPPAQRAWLTKNDGNMVLETLFPKGCVGSDNCSMQIRQPLSNPIEEGTMSYRCVYTSSCDAHLADYSWSDTSNPRPFRGMQRRTGTGGSRVGSTPKVSL